MNRRLLQSVKLLLLLLFCAQGHVVWAADGESFLHSCNFPKRNNDSIRSPLPFLTFHLGAAVAAPSTSLRFHDVPNEGKPMHLQNDLLHSNYNWVPKMNVMIAFKNAYRFTSDIYFVLSSKSSTLERTIQVGEHMYESGSKVHSRFNFFAANLSYIQPLVRHKNYNLGALFGLAGAHAFFSLKNEPANNTVHRSLWFINPIVGLDVYGYLTKKVFYRAAVKLSASPFNKYSYTYLTFKPYVEYHFTKNFGLGLRMDYMNMSIRDIHQKHYNGRLNMNLPVISLVAVVRLF
jgi:hypothetical protein